MKQLFYAPAFVFLSSLGISLLGWTGIVYGVEHVHAHHSISAPKEHLLIVPAETHEVRFDGNGAQESFDMPYPTCGALPPPCDHNGGTGGTGTGNPAPKEK